MHSGTRGYGLQRGNQVIDSAANVVGVGGLNGSFLIGPTNRNYAQILLTVSQLLLAKTFLRLLIL